MEAKLNKTNAIEDVKTEDWLIAFLVSFIPIINLIVLGKWAFDKNTNPNKANWARATLIYLVISVFFVLFFFSTIIGLVASFG